MASNSSSSMPPWRNDVISRCGPPGIRRCSSRRPALNQNPDAHLFDQSAPTRPPTTASMAVAVDLVSLYPSDTRPCVSPTRLPVSDRQSGICSILLIWEASRLASITIAPRRTNLRDHGLRGNRIVPTVHWLSSRSVPTGLSAIHRVSPPCLRRGLHGSVKRHASSPFSTNSSTPWSPSSSPSCLHLLRSAVA